MDARSEARLEKRRLAFKYISNTNWIGHRMLYKQFPQVPEGVGVPHVGVPHDERLQDLHADGSSGGSDAKRQRVRLPVRESQMSMSMSQVSTMEHADGNETRMSTMEHAETQQQHQQQGQQQQHQQHQQQQDTQYECEEPALQEMMDPDQEPVLLHQEMLDPNQDSQVLVPLADQDSHVLVALGGEGCREKAWRAVRPFRKLISSSNLCIDLDIE